MLNRTSISVVPESDNNQTTPLVPPTEEQERQEGQQEEQQNETQEELIIVKNCTDTQLALILKDLPENDAKCNRYPYSNRCPITVMTRCPDPSWLYDYYKKDVTARTTDSHFVAINVGCNKGYDAVRLLRLGSRNPKITRSRWKEGMLQTVGHNKTLLGGAICGQDTDSEDDSDAHEASASSSSVRPSTVYCLEPMPMTVPALRHAKNYSGYNELVVSQVALSSEEGTVFFRNSTSVGDEHTAIGDCGRKRGRTCQEVPMMTLDGYVQKHLPSEEADRIHVLLTDVEGYDFEVMLGGAETLNKTEYLEFEYNWKGMWGGRRDKSTMRAAVNYLRQFGFVCYWAGEQKLWRISQCYLPHYDYKVWSNVACVNHRLAPVQLANSMERTFKNTLARHKR